jgi:type III restriction enzyme
VRIKFDAAQEYQLDAIASVVDLLDGQPLGATDNELLIQPSEGELLTELGVRNSLVVSDPEILTNLQAVQKRNGVAVDDSLDSLNFSIEMETGTGKTYVYLRTIHELRRKYGLKKFIIVVPSVAIREGVQKSLHLMDEHFADLYDHQPVDWWTYDSKQVSRLRGFAHSNELQILIINIDAFNKKANNVIHQPQDRLSGHRPIEFIQAVNPIVVLDEPQNMESDPARAAIESLNPMMTLRYSATHRALHHLVYRLDPVRAYDLGLVKRIEVDSVVEDRDLNRPYVHLKSVKSSKSKVTALIEIDVLASKGISRKAISVSQPGTDLFEKSGEREIYQGWVVEEIDSGSGLVEFSNGQAIEIGRPIGGQTDALMKAQVYETVREHLDKERKLLRRAESDPESAIKVLTLFFIDRVANYAAENGKIRRWFVEAYEELRQQARYSGLDVPRAEEAHGGYFARDKHGPKDTSGNTKADDETYALIMKDKERLLDPQVPLRFIFSHSALREGWDNPNVFQICTLNETKSEVKRRQEIGRGLRLPVQVSGDRCFDPDVNRLTVVANEAYEDFARALQNEISEETGIEFGKERIKNRRKRQTIRFKKGWDADPEFLALWGRINHRTRYRVDFSTDELVTRAKQLLAASPPVVKPRLRVSKAAVDLTEEGLDTVLIRASEADAGERNDNLVPDLIGHLQRNLELRRSTLARILIESGRLSDVKLNPQEFIARAQESIRQSLDELLIQGVKYEKVAGDAYEMVLFENNEIEGYLDRMVKVDNSIAHVIECDSDIEREFAKAIDKRGDIRLFLKLPPWFTVDTPIGLYNPDWALVKEDNDGLRLYLVRETKGTTDMRELREVERQKIHCGERHFSALNIDYRHVASAAEV